jgi:hypothetical protein
MLSISNPSYSVFVCLCYLFSWQKVPALRWLLKSVRQLTCNLAGENPFLIWLNLILLLDSHRLQAAYISEILFGPVLCIHVCRILTSFIKWFIMQSDVFVCVTYILLSSVPCFISTLLFGVCAVKINVKVFAWSKREVVISWDSSDLFYVCSLVMPPILNIIKIWQSSVL